MCRWYRLVFSMSQLIRVGGLTIRCPLCFLQVLPCRGVERIVFESNVVCAVSSAELFPTDESFVEVLYGERVVRGFVLVDRAGADAGGAPVAVVPVGREVPIWVAWVSPDQVREVAVQGARRENWEWLSRVLQASLHECRRDYERLRSLGVQTVAGVAK